MPEARPTSRQSEMERQILAAEQHHHARKILEAEEQEEYRREAEMLKLATKMSEDAAAQMP